MATKSVDLAPRLLLRYALRANRRMCFALYGGSRPAHAFCAAPAIKEASAWRPTLRVGTALAGALAACGPRFHEKDAFRRASEGRRTFRRTAARAPPLDPATFEKVDETFGLGCIVGKRSETFDLGCIVGKMGETFGLGCIVGKRGETFDLGCGMGRQTKFLVWVTAGRWVKF